MVSKIKGIVTKISQSVFESVVPGAESTKQVIPKLGLRLCGVNEVFCSEDFVYTIENREALFATLQTLGVCCE